MNETPAIAFENVTKKYGSFEAVSDLTLRLGAGSICGLLGPNGAGKTTAMKTLIGFLHPTSGTVAVDGGPVVPKTFEYLAYVPETGSLFADLNVTQLLEVNRRLHPHHDGARADKLVDTFGLDRRRRLSKQSKGQRAAMALILALATRPRVLVLDEPSSGLDPIFQRVVLDLLIEAAAGGATVLFSSHQIGQVERAADRVAIMAGGKLRLDADVEDLRTNEKIIEATFEGALPPFERAVDEPSVRRVERAGTMIRVHVKSGADAMEARLTALGPASIRVVDRNLEDIFLDVVTESR